MRSELVYTGALWAGFWVAVWQLRRRSGGPRRAARLVGGLVSGAVLARAGGLLLAPAGLLLSAPRQGQARTEFLGAALPALPLAFATAKLGCLVAGCCRAALGEALGFAALAALLRLAPERLAAPLALAGLAAVRLAALPFRPEARLSLLPAVLWLILGALRCVPPRRGPGCPRPGSETSMRTAESSKRGCVGGWPARATSR